MVRCTASDIAEQLVGSSGLTSINKSSCAVPSSWPTGGVQGKSLLVQTGDVSLPVFSVTLWSYSPDKDTTHWKICSAEPGVQSQYTNCSCSA